MIGGPVKCIPSPSTMFCKKYRVFNFEKYLEQRDLFLCLICDTLDIEKKNKVMLNHLHNILIVKYWYFSKSFKHYDASLSTKPSSSFE